LLPFPHGIVGQAYQKVARLVGCGAQSATGVYLDGYGQGIYTANGRCESLHQHVAKFAKKENFTFFGSSVVNA
jgi:hypothetical protein